MTAAPTMIDAQATTPQEDTTPLAIAPPPAEMRALTPTEQSFDLLMDPEKFEHVQRVAKVYASSSLVPQQYRGNVADCVIGLQMAMRLNIDPFMFLQNTYVVSGRPGMEAKLAIALMNQRGPFRGPVQFEFHRDGKGDLTGCTAFANHKNGERCEATVTWDMVVAEGWEKRSGSKWKTIPEQMFRYRSAVFLGRAYCPEVLMGMPTTDELEDVYQNTRYIPSQTVIDDPRASPASAGNRVAQRIKAQQAEQAEDAASRPEVIEPGDEGMPEPSAADTPAPAAPERADPDAPSASLNKGQLDLVQAFADRHGVTGREAEDALNDHLKPATVDSLKADTLKVVHARLAAGEFDPA